ncbi:MAG TPA: PLP-dependent aminotransferase family protein [bacterium]|mgnify:CR=1 FL=1|nr:PLP-dependent aminotransferase family protein [bacterium]
MILFDVDRHLDIPLYRQIIQKIIRAVENKTLKPGDTLPATRVLAEKLGVNRSTVYRAYEELFSLGYIESSQGSYTRIRHRIQPVTLDLRRESRIDWSGRSTAFARILAEKSSVYHPEYETPVLSHPVINFSQLDLDTRLFPVTDFQRCLNQIFQIQGPAVLAYGDPLGNQTLRNTLSQRLRMHGIAASGDEILITSGAQQAIDLIVRSFINPGDTVMVEMPTYANILPLLTACECRLLGIPMLPDGMDLDYLERILEKETPGLIYTIPNFQNPTGITTSQEHRECLLDLCDRKQVLIVEDGFEEEMKYFGKVVLPIKSMDHHNTVIYLGTFSKVLFPGIRIGWIAADINCVKRLASVKRFTDISSSHPIQAALDQFIRMGYYDANLKRLHRIFRRRMQCLLDAMKNYLPDTISWTRPAGGYTIWARLPFDVEEAVLKERLMKHNVMVSHGSYYFLHGKHSDWIRLSIANVDEREINEGIQRLGEGLTDLARR